PRQPMPFFVRPIARKLCEQVQKKLVDPNVSTALAFMEGHLARHTWFAGEQLSIADFQMSFPVVAALSRGAGPGRYPALLAYKERIEARPAYRRAVEKGGPVLMAA
ncbi:MAG: glutathione binding-like protein, partial [Sulfuritalea sp.]|nr:glutathione binding-like protein [Sulfuritalea sp.]